VLPPPPARFARHLPRMAGEEPAACSRLPTRYENAVATATRGSGPAGPSVHGRSGQWGILEMRRSVPILFPIRKSGEQRSPMTHKFTVVPFGPRQGGSSFRRTAPENHLIFQVTHNPKLHRRELPLVPVRPVRCTPRVRQGNSLLPAKNSLLAVGNSLVGHRRPAGKPRISSVSGAARREKSAKFPVLREFALRPPLRRRPVGPTTPSARRRGVPGLPR
jgi:hypothetical protein